MNTNKFIKNLYLAGIIFILTGNNLALSAMDPELYKEEVKPTTSFSTNEEKPTSTPNSSSQTTNASEENILIQDKNFSENEKAASEAIFQALEDFDSDPKFFYNRAVIYLKRKLNEQHQHEQRGQILKNLDPSFDIFNNGPELTPELIHNFMKKNQTNAMEMLYALNYITVLFDSGYRITEPQLHGIFLITINIAQKVVYDPAVWLIDGIDSWNAIAKEMHTINNSINIPHYDYKPLIKPEHLMLQYLRFNVDCSYEALLRLIENLT